MRRTRRWIAVLAVVVMLPIINAMPAQAVAANPVLFPEDGAVVRTTDLVITAHYAEILASVGGQRIEVLDVTTGVTVPCADSFMHTAATTAARCRVRELTPGHQFSARASFYGRSGSREDTWSFSVSAPVLTATTPPARGTAAAAPSPDQPVTAAYDKPLDTTRSGGQLFATPGGVRSLVNTTVTTTGSQISLAPPSPLAAGTYAAVLRAVAADDPASVTRSTVVFSVGSTVSFAAAPTRPVVVPCCVDGPLPEWLEGPPEALLGVVVYDPAQPTIRRVAEAKQISYCGSSYCAANTLPVGGLSGGRLAWYAYSRIGDIVTPTPDRVLDLPPAAPSAATDVTVTAPLSGDAPSYLRLTASVADTVTGVRFRKLGAPYITAQYSAPVAGRVDLSLDSRYVDDGSITVDLSSYDAAGRTVGEQFTVTKESVSLALTSPLSGFPIRGQDPIVLSFNEPVRSDVAVVIRDERGAAVASTADFTSTRGNRVRVTPSRALTTQTYALSILARARTCPTAETSTCESWSGTVQQPVDSTAPVGASQVVVNPRFPDPTVTRVTFSGRATPSDLVYVTVGSGGSAQLAVPTSGEFSFDIDISSLPRAALPVKVTTSDSVGNLTVLAAGTVDRRMSSSLSQRVSPTAIPYGTTTQVSGRLVMTDGQTPLARRSVGLYQLRDNGAVLGLARTTTDSNGNYRLTPVLTASGRLKAVFSGDSGQRAVTSALSTRVVVGAASNPADHPGTLAAGQSAAASPQNRLLVDRLSSSRDVDVFSFGVARSGKHRIVLGHLPVTATLELFDRGGHLMVTSGRSGRQFEELIRYLPAGTYLVRVRSLDGAASRTDYHLRFGRVADGVVLLSKRVQTAATSDGPHLKVTGELYNNTSAGRGPAVRFRCAFSSGRTTARDEYWVGFALPAGKQRPFEMVVDRCPTGTTLRVDVLSGTTLSLRQPSVTLTLGATTANRFGREYQFTARNNGEQRSGPFSAFLVEYDTEGSIMGWASSYEGSLAPHATRRSRASSSTTSTPNSVRAYVGPA